MAGRLSRRETFTITDFGVPAVERMRLVLDSVDAALGASEVVYPEDFIAAWAPGKGR